MKKLLLTLLLTLAACTTYPLGMTEEQWNALSPVQQQEAQVKQQRQDELERQQRAERIRQWQEEQIANRRSSLETHARQRLGITEAEWAQFPPERRLQFRQEQESIERDMAQEARYRDEQAMRDREMAMATQNIANAMNERSRRELYANSAYGSVVDCQLSGGKAKFEDWHTKWAEIAPARFSVAKGDNRNVELRRLDKQKRTTSFWVAFKESQELEFCMAEDTQQRYKRCKVHPVNGSYKQGYTTPFTIPKVLEGATLTCRFAPGRR